MLSCNWKRRNFSGYKDGIAVLTHTAWAAISTSVSKVSYDLQLRRGVAVRASVYNNLLCWTDGQKRKMTMEMKFCQSCGMPLTNEIFGTNADDTPNEDYCIYCYKDGKFVQDITMEQMINHCAQFTDEINKNSGQNLTVEQMKEQMRQFFPHLKRWKN